MDYFNAFWVGGLICALVQILMEKTKLMPGRIMVLLVCTGAVISFFGWYQAFYGVCGRGRQCAAAGLRKYSDEGCQGSHIRKRIYRAVPGRFQDRRSGVLCRSGVWVSGKSYL